MTKLELKQVQTRNGARFEYKYQLGVILRQTPPLDVQGNQRRGFLDGDMDEAEALADKIEEANGSVELTAAEVMQIVSKVERFEWPFSDKAFRQFAADMRALRDQ
jgi:hypothetical protein